MVATWCQRLSGLAARRPLLTVGLVLALALAGGGAALGLRPSGGIDTFVSSSSASYRATAGDARHFGDDAVIVLVREPLGTLVTTDLATLTRLEACLAGQEVAASPTLGADVPVTSGSPHPYGGWAGPCGRLMRTRAAQVVYGPGTFLNRAAAAVNAQVRLMLTRARDATRAAAANADTLARRRGLSRREARAAASAAGRLESAQQLERLEQVVVSSGISGAPSIENANFIRQIVFDPARGDDQPRARFSYLFPTANAALVSVRLRSTLSDRQQAAAIAAIRQAVRLPMFRLSGGGTYTVTGLPVVINDLAGEITGSIATLLIAAVLVMAATLLLVFRARLRLVPLAIGLAATGITFGLLAAVGATLTIASIAVLPILIGLAVDYGIQFQARAQEAQRDAVREGGPPLSAADAVSQAAGRAAPAIAAAALATATGFLVLLLSAVPMVRGFGLLLVVGIAVAFGCAITAGSAMLVLGERDGGLLGASLRGAGEILGPPLRGAGAIVGARHAVVLGRRVQATGGRVVGAVGRRPGRVLAVAAVLAVAGWIADTQTGVQSDVTKLVPRTMPALAHLRTLERTTGVSGEIDVTVRGANVATPATVRWMTGYETELLRHFGDAEQTGCAHATLCPALSLPDLFSGDGRTTPTSSLTRSQINGLLGAVPAYFSQAVITKDHREATLAFGIRLEPLARQQRVIAYMRPRLHPPAGTTAALAGLPVLTAQANASLSSTGHRFLTLVAALLAVGLVLALVLRRPERALVPMIPIVLATGWSALVLFAIGIALNPMSATLGTLVIAISTEFSVLLSERYRQERAAGVGPDVALAHTYRSTGTAVLASGVTAVAGFGVLVFSNITMLRDFGFVTLVDLSVSLAGVLLVLPATLALSERRGAGERLRDVRRAADAGAGRLRRRPRVA